MQLSATLIIVAITVLVSIQAFKNTALFEKLVFNPFTIKSRKEWYRFLSHALLHGSFGHLAINMYVLYMFGQMVERQFGQVTHGNGILPFLGLYVGAVLFSSLPSYRKRQDDPTYNAVGASGGTSAIVVAFGLLNPFEWLLFPPLPGWAFVIAFIAYEHYMDKKSSDNVAHDAHFYGALYGVAYTLFLYPQVLTNLMNGIKGFLG